MPLSLNMRGAMFMAISMAGFTMNDAITKAVAANMNMGQVMLLRGLFATGFVALIAWQQGALRSFEHVRHPMVLLRVAGEASATMFFLIALTHLPIANVSAVLQALPLAVTLGAALVLSEPVGWRRWLAIIGGFVGVLIIVRPGFDGFSVYSLSALACVFCCTVRDLATRKVPPEIPTLLISLTTSVAVTSFGAVLIVPFGGWTPPSVQDLGLLFAAALLLIIGYQFIISAMRIGDISFVAPFRYTALIWAILLGFVLFGDIPDMPMIVGACLIILSGLYALYRERVRGARRPAAESTSPGMATDGL